MLLFLISSLILLESENILCMILIPLNLLRFVLWLRIRSFWMFHLPLKRTYNLLLLGGVFYKCQFSQLVLIFYIIAVIIFLHAVLFFILYCCNIFMLFYIIAVTLCCSDLLYYWYSVYLTYWLLQSAVVDGASQMVQLVKNPPAKAGDSRDEVSAPGSGRSPGVGNATQPSILACRIPQTEEPGGLQSMGSYRVKHKWTIEHPHRDTVVDKYNCRFLSLSLSFLATLWGMWDLTFLTRDQTHALQWEYGVLTTAPAGKSLPVDFSIFNSLVRSISFCFLKLC